MSKGIVVLFGLLLIAVVVLVMVMLLFRCRKVKPSISSKPAVVPVSGTSRTNKFATEATDILPRSEAQQTSIHQQHPSIDEQKVESLINQQSQVSSELGDLTSESSEQQGGDSSVELDDRHKDFLDKLLIPRRWFKDEVSNFAQECRLMPDGAVETINNWAIKHYQEPLFIDDNDYWDLDQDIAKCINHKFRREG